MAGAAESIDQLRAAGVPVCLDDLGRAAQAFAICGTFESIT